MSIIEFEVEEIKKLCENVVPNSKIIVCTASPPALVRVDIIEKSQITSDKKEDVIETNRQLTVCFRFPESYPQQHILVELKSRTLSDKFLNGLTELCETQAKSILGKPQGLHVLRFLQQFLHENPLCVCIDEIQQLRRDLGKDNAPEQLKLKQRSSTIIFTAKGGSYYYRVRAVIPDDYPRSCVLLQDGETNLPILLLRYLNGQSREIARQCVEPPLTKTKTGKSIDFQPKPSLYRSLKFCLDATRDFHCELCPICEKRVLPTNPDELEKDDTKDAYIERVYCGHLYHQGCLKQYMAEPPFPKDGKVCPAKRSHERSDSRSYITGGSVNKAQQNCVPSASKCGIRLAHDRWVINVKLAESRWAQKQARERELQEVMDFLK